MSDTIPKTIVGSCLIVRALVDAGLLARRDQTRAAAIVRKAVSDRMEDTIGTLETLVEFHDEIRTNADADPDYDPMEDVGSVMNYINVQARAVVVPDIQTLTNWFDNADSDDSAELPERFDQW